MPLTGNPPYPFPSGISDFCNSPSAPPPAPRKTNFALVDSPLAALSVVDVQAPATAWLAMDMRHVMGIMDGTARKLLEMGNEVAGERAIIDVRAGDHARR